MSKILELGYNLLSTISLALKFFEVFLRKTGYLSKIVVDKKVFGLANIIDNK